MKKKGWPRSIIGSDKSRKKLINIWETSRCKFHHFKGGMIQRLINLEWEKMLEMMFDYDHYFEEKKVKLAMTNYIILWRD